jgi:serine/threonine protein kinase
VNGSNDNSNCNGNLKLKGAVGTSHYMAPEVIKSSHDEKCDIWSLGIIAF